MNNRAIFTALAGEKSRLLSPTLNAVICGIDYICFTDQPAHKIPSPWQVRPLEIISEDPNRNAKQYKLQPHKFMDDYPEVCWMDANFLLKKNPFNLLSPEDTSPIFGKHFERNCLYQEAEVVKSMGLDPPEVIEQQMTRYRQEGFPENYGMAECGFYVLPQSWPNAWLFDTWWREVVQGSRRDQLSFMYSAWRTNIPIKLVENFRNSEYAAWKPHIEMSQLYNKTKQLREVKGIKVKENISRVETRFKKRRALLWQMGL